MKAAVLTTGIVFGLPGVAHLARVAREGLHLAQEPFSVLATVVPAALGAWAWRLLRAGRSRETDNGV